MCMKDLKRKITKKTLAVIGVHCFGLAADIKALVKISREKKYGLNKFKTYKKFSLRVGK